MSNNLSKWDELNEEKTPFMIPEEVEEEMDLPADPKMVIELSKEISRLIAEGKTQNMSSKAATMLTSKEDAKELLLAFLES